MFFSLVLYSKDPVPTLEEPSQAFATLRKPHVGVMLGEQAQDEAPGDNILVADQRKLPLRILSFPLRNL